MPPDHAGLFSPLAGEPEHLPAPTRAFEIWRSLGLAPDGLGVVGQIIGCPHRAPLIGERRWLVTLLPPFEPETGPGAFVMWCYERPHATVADMVAHEAVGLAAWGAAANDAEPPIWSRVANLEVLARCQRIAAKYRLARPLLRA